MPLCKRKVYVIRGFHGNKVAIYSKGGKRRENRRPVEKVKMVWFGLLKGGKTIRLWEKQTTGRSGIRGNKKKMGGRRGGGGGKKNFTGNNTVMKNLWALYCLIWLTSNT